MSSAGPCIIVKGSTGTCKTTVLRALAEAYGKRDGNGLVTLHLGEQVDSKVCAHARFRFDHTRSRNECLLLIFYTFRCY